MSLHVTPIEGSPEFSDQEDGPIIVNSTPPDQGGVFDFIGQLEWAKIMSQFKEAPAYLGQDEIHNGTLMRYGFTTMNGYSYDAVVGIPDEKHQTTTIPTLQTSAWVTSSRGHNEHTIRHLVDNGIPTFFVGAEGSWRPDKKKIPKNPITLTNSAAAVLQFARVISDGFPNDIIDKRERTVIGESRGGMVGMGLIALDQMFDQDVLFADLTAPCFPRKAEVRDILKLSGHLLSEPRSILKLAGRLGMSRLIHYPSTIDPHPLSIAHQIGMGPALFSGEAGDLARLITTDKIIHVTCFNDDFASMPSEWDEIFANHPGVRITLLDGSHLTIADPETLSYIVARNKSFQKEYKSGNKLLDGQNIFTTAHELLDIKEA